MHSILVLFSLISLCLAKVDRLEIRRGHDFRYQVTTNSTQWARRVPLQRHRGIQVIDACLELEETAKCFNWNDKKGNVFTDTSRSRFYPNGTLIIYQVVEEDTGTYWIPGKTEFQTIGEDGKAMGWHNGFELVVW
ncbi:unnamed protein product, partial [Mesorhabditis belari]|uniref:Uncharacterized protein n=1 Tax=Mesorhabditis belari TaxID=2138241 RepID=A0AAF3F9W6_9BILA